MKDITLGGNDMESYTSEVVTRAATEDDLLARGIHESEIVEILKRQSKKGYTPGQFISTKSPSGGVTFSMQN